VVYVVRITRADIGARVVIRRRVAGPVPLTDVIGTLEDWTAGVLTVVTAAGEVTTVPEGDLVAAKVVPPAPIRRSRLDRRSQAVSTDQPSDQGSSGPSRRPSDKADRAERTPFIGEKDREGDPDADTQDVEAPR